MSRAIVADMFLATGVGGAMHIAIGQTLVAVELHSPGMVLLRGGMKLDIGRGWYDSLGAGGCEAAGRRPRPSD